MTADTVWQPVWKHEVPQYYGDASTWTMKKESNGTNQARLTVRGYEKVDGVNSYVDSKSAPVANIIKIWLGLIVRIMYM